MQLVSPFSTPMGLRKLLPSLLERNDTTIHHLEIQAPELFNCARTGAKKRTLKLIRASGVRNFVSLFEITL